MSSPQSKSIRILIIDDDPSMSTIVQSLTGLPALEVSLAGKLKDGLQLASKQRFDLILLDHLLPDGAGLDHIETLIGQDRLRPVLYVTAQSGSLTAIEAIKRGAYDYLSKPLDFDLLKQRIAEAVEYRQLTRLPVLVESKDETTQLSDVLVGRCRAMQEVYKGIGRLAGLAAPVLIEGEVGTGKEMVARAIHEHGASAGQAFVKLSTTDAVEERLTESIFGTANSNATEMPSLSGGTLMIEEVGGLSSAFQSRLLRFFHEPNPGLRIILATSTPARDLVQQGRLRGDLYYFLSPYLIAVPSLRHRMDDLELLVAHFMQNLGFVSATRDADGPPRVSPAAMNLLKKFDWPGNVAQLKSVIQSVLLESRGAVLATDSLRRALSTGAAESMRSRSNAAFGDETSAWDIAEFVRTELEQGTDQLYDKAVSLLDQRLVALVLNHTQGNQAQAARLLGMTRTSLRRKIAAQTSAINSEPQADPRSHAAT